MDNKIFDITEPIDLHKELGEPFLVSIDELDRAEKGNLWKEIERHLRVRMSIIVRKLVIEDGDLRVIDKLRGELAGLTYVLGLPNIFREQLKQEQNKRSDSK